MEENQFALFLYIFVYVYFLCIFCLCIDMSIVIAQNIKAMREELPWQSSS